MITIVERLKSWVKKHAPRQVYIVLYKLFKYWEVYILRRETSLSLVQFNERQFKTLQYGGGVTFAILLDPGNGSIDKEIFVHGSWEEDMLAIMRTHIKVDSVCLDVGANIGHHTLFMAKLARDGAVHSFEPLLKLCAQIDESVRKNNIQNVYIHPYGLSNVSETHTIQTNLLNIGKTTLDSRYQGGVTEEVSIKRLDDIWDTEIPVSFVKIDVEGHEYQALLGMEQMLKKDLPVLLFEYSPVFYRENQTDCRELLLFILNLKYRIFDCNNNNQEVTINTMDAFVETCTFQTNLVCLPERIYVEKN